MQIIALSTSGVKMTTRQVLTVDLEGPDLRYAVARAMGYHIFHSEGVVTAWCDQKGNQVCVVRSWEPDRDWNQLGPAFPRFGLEFRMGELCVHAWATFPRGIDLVMASGMTHQEAACRAIVISHFGQTMTLPINLNDAYGQNEAG